MPSKKTFAKTGKRSKFHDDDNEAQNYDGNTKKHYQDYPQASPLEAKDIEFSDTKERPPRFSTLFGAPPTVPLPQRDHHNIRSSKAKTGVFVSWPILVALILALLFESTILFAYTVIGLYNNLPPQLGAFGGAVGPAAAACDCSKQPAINIASNFYSGQAGQGGELGAGVLVPDVGKPLPPSTSMSSSTSTSSTTATSTSTTPSANLKSDAIIASNIMSMLEAMVRSTLTESSPSSKVSATSTSSSSSSSSKATPSLVTSVRFVTAPPPEVTVTSVAHEPNVTIDTTVPAKTSSGTSTTSAPSTLITKKSIATSTPTPTTSITKAVSPGVSSSKTTSISASSSKTSTSSTSSAKTSIPPCFGGAGAVQLDCGF